MPTEKYYSQEQVQLFADALEEMEAQQPRRLNKREVVSLLAKQISRLKEKGYSLDEIADKLREKGFEISFSL